MTKISFDYNSVDWRFISRIMRENTLRLSRSRQGKSDTCSSKVKEPLLLEGEALKEKVIQNEETVHRYIYNAIIEMNLQNGEDVKQILFAIADMTNEGLLPKGRFRTWEIHAYQRSVNGEESVSGPEAKVDSRELPEAVTKFCSTISIRWNELYEDPVPLAAWAEWQLNGGPLHPFYDGCGRVSRAFAAYLLVVGGNLLPLYDNSRSYFTHGNEGIETFTVYVRHSIDRCAEWIQNCP